MMYQGLAIFATALALAVGAVAETVPGIKGSVFTINGKAAYYAGVNAWYLSHLYTDADVETVASQINATGFKIVRTWAFGPSATAEPYTIYFNLVNSTGSYVNTGSNGIARLDAAVAAAEKYGFKLILPLLNNWDDLGGVNVYTAAFGGTHQEFFTNTAAQAAYKQWISYAVNRYKNSNAVFAWELANEPRCNGCPTSTITNWATDISKYIKSLDSKHLVTLGDEGWFGTGDGYGDGSYAYGGGEGVSFVKNLAIKTLDFATAHLYPDSWGYNMTWGATWIQQHADAAAKAGKPFMLEEYGTGNDRMTNVPPWQAEVLNTKTAADLYWQFGTTLPSGQNVFDANAYYYSNVSGSDYDVLATQHVKKMAAKKV